MVNSQRFRSKLRGLLGLVWFQRSTRLMLRALWLAGAGYLLAWVINDTWQSLPDPYAWWLVGVLFALPAILVMVFTWRKVKDFSWKLDRWFHLDEQISAALTVKGTGSLDESLLNDASRQVSRLKRRVFWHGWDVAGDLVAILLVAVTFYLVIAVFSIQFYPIPSVQTGQAPLPVLGQEPSLDDVFPTGPLGLEPPKNDPAQTQAAAQGANAGNVENPGGEPDLVEKIQELSDTLQSMGKQLSQQASTNELGEALANLDLKKAAEAIENLADHTSQMSPETQQELADALSKAAEKSQSVLGEQDFPPVEKLAQDLKTASQSLQPENPGETSPGDALDKLAGDLRMLDDLGVGQMPGAGTGSGSDNPTQELEPISRLAGDGSEYEIELEESSKSGWLSASPVDRAGESTAFGSAFSGLVSDPTTNQVPILPYMIPWMWQDAIEIYFQR